MHETIPDIPGYEWLRAYTALSRSGLVTEQIRSCEEAWGTQFLGNPAAVNAARKAPGYGRYAEALRGILTLPLVLYRVTTAEAYESWKAGTVARPVATTVSLASARLIEDVHPESGRKLVLVKGSVSEPEAIIMRGRIELYELVVDSSCISPLDVSILDQGSTS
jgi:hypothetical protein